MKAHGFTSLTGIFLFYIILLYSQGLAFTSLQNNKFIYFEDKEYILKKGDTLVDLAVKFKLGYQALLLANPGVDPWVPPPGSKILLPYKLIVPEEFILKKENYILINLPEMRLYYFRKGTFLTFPIGIGDEGKLPPTGNYKIVRKKEKPYWYPTESIRREEPELPEVVPPGPENPMGDYALYLDKGLFAIHGTNKAYSIGRRTTHGCFRLYPEDIERLFKMVPLKTDVFVTYLPYKLAIEDNSIYLQAFPDIDKRFPDPVQYIIKRLEELTSSKGLTYRINLLTLEEVLSKPDGLIYKIGKIRKTSSSF
ncbi:hypothetical protein THC_1087 [Caldimicrobium thiodismutans]|uniref:Uncharacterized protein n=1 Tax=Caldimicrobium thiodismutans TaxID=1653476 RepID=A0A0U4W2Z9_9BACT|nr:L,D-transpeptidase family protein [Caldimicrobium thiodismutans]BAU23466.1 hypothetical protein THC_1087 [Caldimicrobium thiodismutans]